MSWKNLSHDNAAKYARRAQWAFALVGVGAVAVAAMGTRPHPEAALPPLEVPAPAAPSHGAEGGPRTSTIDTKAIASRLNLVGNRPKPAAKPDDAHVTEAQPEAVPAADSLKFLGVLREPGRLIALLKIGEKQKLLGPGESFGDVKIVEVTENHAVVTEKGVQRKLELQSRSGPSVTFVTGGNSPGQAMNALGNRALGQVNPNNQVPDQRSILERRERAMREAADAQARMEAEGGPVRPKPIGGDKR